MDINHSLVIGAIIGAGIMFLLSKPSKGRLRLGIRIRFRKHNLSALESFGPKYRSRSIARLISQPERPKRLLGSNGATFIYNSLQRSHGLYLTFVDSINRGHRFSLYLVCRAHLETTGALVHFHKNLTRFYANEIAYEEMEGVLHKLSLGGRTFPPKEEMKAKHGIVPPDAINVLSQIDSVDQLWKSIGGKDKPFRDAYDFLSEFCHPNHLGHTLGSEIADGIPLISFSARPSLKDEDFGTALSYMCVSCRLYIHAWDECLKLLREHEEFPSVARRWYSISDFPTRSVWRNRNVA